MKVRYPAKEKRRRNARQRRRLFDPCWKTECTLAKNEAREFSADEALNEFTLHSEWPAKNFWDEDWTDFHPLHGFLDLYGHDVMEGY